MLRHQIKGGKRMKCKIKNVSINYEIIGHGKPIIMLHGYYIDHRLMSGCMEPIFSDKEGYKRIYIDLPGMGKSESSEWIKSSDDMLDIVIGFIEKIIPNEKFLLVGQSYGGYLSRGVLHKMADRVNGIVLICPVIISDYKKRSVEENVVLIKDNELLSKISEEDAEDMNFDFVVQSQRIYERWQDELISDYGTTDEEFLDSLRQNGYGFSFEVDKVHKKYDKPALILLGKQDACVGYKDGWSILENYSRATFAIVDRAGHLLQIEQENLFNSLVNDWLIRVNEF